MWFKKKEESYLIDLVKERDGYVVRNPSNGVTVRCTEKFLESWKARGFEVIYAGKIKLIE
jgi:hypothetical protein